MPSVLGYIQFLVQVKLMSQMSLYVELNCHSSITIVINWLSMNSIEVSCML